MKIQFGHYEIDIKARYTKAGDYKMNKADAMAVLNLISSWAYEAADRNDQLGCHAIAKTARETARELYDQLDAKGYYERKCGKQEA